MKRNYNYIEYNKGQILGECIFIEEIETKVTGNRKRRFAEFLCNCGNIFNADILNVKGRHTKNCGCVRLNKSIQRLTTHGRAHTPEYNAWLAIIARCYNEKTKGYHNYGGRGIEVCERWQYSFESFYADMGKRPSAQHSIDRYPDKNGNYEPSNCRWATKRQQANNIRANLLIEYNGETKTLAEWCYDLNINYKLTHCRIHKLKWTTYEAFTIPVSRNSKYIRIIRKAS